MAGALSVLAVPPIGLFPVWLLTLPVFYLLTTGGDITRIAAFVRGWAFGAGYFIFGLYWISAALFVDFDKFKWVMPFSLLVGPAAFGIYYGFVPLLGRAINKIIGHTVISFVTAFALIEFLRGHLLTGFPWNLAGYSWDHALPMLQIASVVGVYGLTALTLFWAAAPLYWREKPLRIASLSSLIICFLWGWSQVHAHDTKKIKIDHWVRIVQASIPQDMKWDGEQEWKNLEKHIALGKRPAREGQPISAVIWPETAVTTDMQSFPEVARYIGGQLPKNSLGILGTLRFTMNADKTAPEQFFNSVQVVDAKGKILATYDKHHLVPFGEYIPFRDKINMTPLALVVSGFGDFTPGSGPATVAVDALPGFSPLICYEVIFPHEAVSNTDRPAWLVNVTNDAWYGHTAGPYQHLAISRLRAIEQGLPLARAANNGISAMIDPRGRIIESLPLDVVDVIDAPLYPPLPATPFSRWGQTGFFILLGMLMLGGYFSARRAA